MDQFGASAGGALAEIALFQQEDVIAARRRIQRHAHPGGASADHDHVEAALVGLQSRVHFPPVHLFHSPAVAASRRESGITFADARVAWCAPILKKWHFAWW